MKVAVITLVLLFAIGQTFSHAQSVETAVKAAFEPEFVRIPAGRFRLGSDIGMVDESPAHAVVIEREFWLQATEVTQAEWESVMGVNPSSKPGCGRCPVETVSWDEVKRFIAKLNERDEEFEYRLPSEAEWEYAAREGTVADALPTLDSEAWLFHRQVGRRRAAGRLEESEPVGPVRHSRKCMVMGRRPLWSVRRLPRRRTITRVPRRLLGDGRRHPQTGVPRHRLPKR